jgi:hypothetical protein
MGNPHADQFGIMMNRIERERGAIGILLMATKQAQIEEDIDYELFLSDLEHMLSDRYHNLCELVTETREFNGELFFPGS